MLAISASTWRTADASAAFATGGVRDIGFTGLKRPWRCPVLTQPRPLVRFAVSGWGRKGQLTPKTHWRTRQGQCRPLPVRRTQGGLDLLEPKHDQPDGAASTAMRTAPALR